MNEKRLYPSAALHGQVAHEIGRQIVSGAIGEGEFLPREAELSEQFSVSRQAIREALKVLAAKGLVASRRRAGTYVMPRTTWNLLDPDVLAWHPRGELSPEFINDLIELRRLIEPAAARHAALRGEAHKVEQIGAALAKMRLSVADPAAYSAADAEFHSALFAASGNTLIDRLSNILSPLYETTFRQTGRQEGTDLEYSVNAHASIYEAIRAGDAARAEEAITGVLDLASDAVARLAGRRGNSGR